MIPESRRKTIRDAATGGIVAVLIAVVAHVLGVQQLLRTPDLALYLPAGLVGAAIGPTRLRPLLWIAATPLVILCLAVAYTPVARGLGEAMIRRDALPAKVDAIAALGNGLTPDGRMRSETLARLITALSLAQRLPAEAILVSRERRLFDGRTVSDSADQTQFAALVKPVTLVFVDSVFTTRTEALRMKSIADPRGWSTLAVVTSPLHTRRACATFEAVGFHVVCVPAAARDSGLAPESNAEDRLRLFRYWLYEMFATAQYRSNGWIH